MQITYHSSYVCGSGTAGITMFLHLFPIHAACSPNFYSIFHMQVAHFVYMQSTKLKTVMTVMLRLHRKEMR